MYGVDTTFWVVETQGHCVSVSWDCWTIRQVGGLATEAYRLKFLYQESGFSCLQIEDYTDAVTYIFQTGCSTHSDSDSWSLLRRAPLLNLFPRLILMLVIENYSRQLGEKAETAEGD